MQGQNQIRKFAGSAGDVIFDPSVKVNFILLEKARQELKDQLDEVPADRREFYFAWKKHTEKVIGILTKMPGHVLREFFEVEIQDSRHKIELEVEQRGAKVKQICMPFA